MQHVTAEFGLDQIEQAGIQAVRQQPISWKAIEPVRTDPPTYQWDPARSLELDLANAAEAGLQSIVPIQFTPDWAQALAGHSCGPIRPDRLDAFAQFLETIVRRYSEPPYNVKYWELFNEPDVDPSLVRPDSVFGCWGDQQDEFYGGRTYAQMLKQAYPAIKRANPQAVVILGGLLLDAPNSNQGQYLRGVLEGGGGDYFDIVAFHAYTFYDPVIYNWDTLPGTKWLDWGGFLIGKTAFLRQIMSEYGYDKPLMLNEVGLAWVRPGEPTDDYRQAKADYAIKVYTRGLALNLVNVSWYGWRQPNWRQMALLDQGQESTPAYQALAFLIDQLDGTKYRGPTNYPGLEGYTFRRGKDLLQVVWSADGSEVSLPIPADRFLQAFDRSGQRVATGEVQDPITFSVRRPLFLKLRADS